MKRIRRRLPIPQFEFGFASDTFNLSVEFTLDGERISRERDEDARARQEAESAQTALFTSRKVVSPYRLREGDIVRYEGEPCPVVRVNDCAAVVAVARPAREFTTLFGKRVRLQPKPALVRISPQSEIPILNR